MIQEIITYSIGVAAAFIICRSLYRTFSGKGTKSCGCTSCECCNERKGCR